jgi:hypothetical protein
LAVNVITFRIASNNKLISVGKCTFVSTTKESHRPRSRSLSFF